MSAIDSQTKMKIAGSKIIIVIILFSGSFYFKINLFHLVHISIHDQKPKFTEPLVATRLA
jgi:hypothetical protein